ncbi:MAG TPA: MDR family MFS transporter [Ktedonobacterales bacterium]|nr:MDR family MFS transporter [Ktedonobacterales bacterium]
MAKTVAASEAISAEATSSSAQGAGLALGQLIPVLVGLLLGMLLAALDQTVVGTAMPRVIADLGGQNVTWVYTSYLLATTVGVPIYGKLSDIYGRRFFFIGGMAVFLLGSALSGASQNMTELILFRGVQGLGAGALMPIAQAIIGDIFPPAERGKWQGIFTGVFGLATILGPILGGWITDNFSWRWVFYVNMPIGAIALVAAGLTLPRHFNRRQHKIDYFGSATLVLWAAPLLLAVSLGGNGANQFAWNSWQIISLFALAVVALITFLVIEFRVAEPILNPRLFKNSIFTVSVAAMFLVSAGMFGAILYLPYFTQDVLLQKATNSGALLTPMMIGFIISSLVGGWLLSLTGRYKLMALTGFAVATVGMFLLSRMTVNTTNLELIRNMVITGLGIGVMMSLFTIIVQNAFPLKQLGEVTAALSFFRSMGGTIGLAVFGAVLINSIGPDIHANLPAVLKPLIPASKLNGFGQSTGGGSSLQALFAHFGAQGVVLAQQFELAIRVGLASALSELFLFSAGAMALGFVLSLFLREIPLRKGKVTAHGASNAKPDATEATANADDTADGVAEPVMDMAF